MTQDFALHHLIIKQHALESFIYLKLHNSKSTNFTQIHYACKQLASIDAAINTLCGVE